MANDASGLKQPGFHDPARCGVCNPNFQDDVPVVGCFENASPDEGMPRRESYSEAYHKDFENLSKVQEDDPLDRDQPSVSPSHYDLGNGLESIDVIYITLSLSEFVGFCKGNILKYLHRANRKGGEPDLRKAGVYAGWMVEALDGRSPYHG